VRPQGAGWWDARRRLCGFATLAVVALFFPAPVSAQLFGGDDVARKQIAEQGKRLEALRLQNEDLAARLGRMEEWLKGLANSNPALDLAQQLERLRQELMQLRGQIEVVGNDIQMAAKRQRDMYVDLDTRMKRLEQQPAAEAPPPAPVQPSPGFPPPPAAAAGAGAPAVAAPDREQRAYEAALAQHKAGNYSGAIAGFRNFISQYPKSPLAHRAQYWIGDSYYNLRDYRNAIASQQRLISGYPDSASVPDALLNVASSQVGLGDAPGARRTLDKLVARYPASDAAEKARRRLATLK
jgi:tol-pal system protein YbgF